jgi:hypothetical protein
MIYKGDREDLSVWEDTNEQCFEEVVFTSSLGSVLQQRGSRYGEFISNANVSQDLKCIMEQSTNWNNMDNDMREALHMIAHKISRILEGDYSYDDSWVDIAGYSTLVAERLQKGKTSEG